MKINQYLQVSISLAGHAVSSVADQHKSAELVLHVCSPNHWEVVLKDQHHATVTLHTNASS